MFQHISTKNLIYLTLFLSPAYLIRFSIFSVPLNFLDILILITFLFWFFRNGLTLSKNLKKSFEKIKFLLPPILLLLTGLFISTFLNNNILKEFGIIKSWFLLPLLFGLIIFNEIHKQQDIRNLLKTIFFSSLSISIVSLIYLICDKLTYDGRLSAFYLSPNHLAMILAPGLLIGFWEIFENKKFNFKKFIYLIPILISLFFTHSYGAWISLLITIFIILFFTQKKYILPLILFFLLVISFEYNSIKFQTLSNLQNNSSLNSRVIIWKSSTKIISDNWLWGIGPGNFQEKYLDYQKYFPPYLEWAVPQPHNLLLAFWLQTGILGLLGFIFLLLLFIIKMIKILISSKDFYQKEFALTILTIIIFYFLHGLIDTPYWKNDLSLLFWSIIFTGLSVNSTHRLSNNNSK